MTLGDLIRYRNWAPFIIIQICAAPFTSIFGLEGSIAHGAALALGFLYVGVSIRDRWWDLELRTNAQERIRRAFLRLVPANLAVTSGEERRLLEKEVIKRVTGIFWEAIDRDPAIREQKPHFYANGLVYTASIDVYVIMHAAAIVYAGAWLWSGNAVFLVLVAAAIVLGAVSRIFVIPHRRKRHNTLVDEQLESIERLQLEFVQNRFREIVGQWRTERGSDGIYP